MLDRSYTDLALRQAMALLAIDSPTGFTEKAAQWVQTAFASLGYEVTAPGAPAVYADAASISPWASSVFRNSR